jgi:hypothetical protein
MDSIYYYIVLIHIIFLQIHQFLFIIVLSNFSYLTIIYSYQINSYQLNSLLHIYFYYLIIFCHSSIFINLKIYLDHYYNNNYKLHYLDEIVLSYQIISMSMVTILMIHILINLPLILYSYFLSMYWWIAYF